MKNRSRSAGVTRMISAGVLKSRKHAMKRRETTAGVTRTASTGALLRRPATQDHGTDSSSTAPHTSRVDLSGPTSSPAGAVKTGAATSRNATPDSRTSTTTVLSRAILAEEDTATPPRSTSNPSAATSLPSALGGEPTTTSF